MLFRRVGLINSLHASHGLKAYILYFSSYMAEMQRKITRAICELTLVFSYKPHRFSSKKESIVQLNDVDASILSFIVDSKNKFTLQAKTRAPAGEVSQPRQCKVNYGFHYN